MYLSTATFAFLCFLMVTTRSWKVLCWNVRGLNSQSRQRAVRNKVEESQCQIVCLQETKMEFFDLNTLRTCCPKRFDQFVFSPSVGASGGLLIVWDSRFFTGILLDVQPFGLAVRFTSSHNHSVWTLVNVYGPCDTMRRDAFVQWLYHIVIPSEDNWLILGDFNFIRSADNRNQPSGDTNDMFIFNEIIDHLGLLELPIKGRSYTWSNMQDSPLLEQLDWFFTSANWISDYPMTQVLPLAKTASDHVPCVVSIGTTIPKSNIFRFENFWIEQEGFMDCVKRSWSTSSVKSHITARLVDKFKRLRGHIKTWQRNISNLKLLIQKCTRVIFILDCQEEF